jgi:hypothetical protein
VDAVDTADYFYQRHFVYSGPLEVAGSDDIPAKCGNPGKKDNDIDRVQPVVQQDFRQEQDQYRQGNQNQLYVQIGNGVNALAGMSQQFRKFLFFNELFVLQVLIEYIPGFLQFFQFHISLVFLFHFF